MKKIIIIGLILIILAFSGCTTTRDKGVTGPEFKNDVKVQEEFLEEARAMTHFMTKEEVVQALSEEDDYLSRFSKYDYQSRFKTEYKPTEAELEEHYSKVTSEFSEEEKEQIVVAMAQLLSRIKPLNLNMPSTINFATTTDEDEGGAAYTRGTTIVLPDQMGNNQSSVNKLVAHEFFHVFSRYNKERRSDFYGVINYKPMDEFSYPKELADLKISNPDAPILNHYIELEYKGKIYKCVPAYIAEHEYDIKKGGSFLFDAKEVLFPIEIVKGKPEVIVKDGKPMTIDKKDTNMVDKIGKDTGYTIHPEETVADLFSLYVIEANLETPQYTNKLIETISN